MPKKEARLNDLLFSFQRHRHKCLITTLKERFFPSTARLAIPNIFSFCFYCTFLCSASILVIICLWHRHVSSVNTWKTTSLSVSPLMQSMRVTWRGGECKKWKNISRNVIDGKEKKLSWKINLLYDKQVVVYKIFSTTNFLLLVRLKKPFSSALSLIRISTTDAAEIYGPPSL